MKCTNSNFKAEGQKVTWDVTCAGPPATTGTGEVTRESDSAWSGVVKLSGGEGAMTITISARKLEECEARP